MSRSRRVFKPGKVYHLSQSGNNQVAVFHTDEDRHTYLQILRVAAKAEKCSIHGWCLLENQIDLLVSAGDTSAISRMMSRAQGQYARRFNRVWQRTGSLWRKRFRHNEIEYDSYLPSCFRHLDRLPVIKRLANHPSTYPWTSHQEHASGRKSDLLTLHRVYLEAGATPEARQSTYRKWMSSRTVLLPEPPGTMGNL